MIFSRGASVVWRGQICGVEGKVARTHNYDEISRNQDGVWQEGNLPADAICPPEHCTRVKFCFDTLALHDNEGNDHITSRFQVQAILRNAGYDIIMRESKFGNRANLLQTLVFI